MAKARGKKRGKTATRKQRRRVDRDRVRAEARRQEDGRDWLRLPRGVREWQPEKKGVYELDVLPYEVKTKFHPDNKSGEPGELQGQLWFKRPYKVHYGVGGDNNSVVCPTSVGKRCPICEERTRLCKNYADNEKRIRKIKAKEMVMMAIVDPDDRDSVAIFNFSKYKFYTVLKKELDEGSEDNVAFFDFGEDGRTVKVRFSEASFENSKYLEATRIDFEPRDEIPEELLEQVPCLDELLNVFSYSRIKGMFFEMDVEGEDKDEDDRKPKDVRSRRPSAAQEDSDSEDEDEDEGSDESEGDDDSNEGEEGEEEEEEEEEPESDDEEEEEEEEPESDDEEEEEEEEEPDSDDEEGEEEEEEEEPQRKRGGRGSASGKKATKKASRKKGSRR